LTDTRRGKKGYLYNAIRKYGEAFFKFEVLNFAESKSDLDLLEDFFIMQLDTLSPNGYNLKRGGAQGKHSEKLISRMTKIRANPEVRARIAAGRNAGMAKPGVYARWLAALREAFARPEVRERLSIKATKSHARPEVKERHRAGCKKGAATRSYEERAETAKLAHANPETKLKHQEGCKRGQNRPEVRAASAERLRRERADAVKEEARMAALRKTLAHPDVARRKSEAMKEVHKRPGMSAMMRARAIEALSDPEVRERIAAGTRGSKWITDGANNKRLKPGCKLPDGWKYGVIQQSAAS
jgi:hypothetical protein